MRTIERVSVSLQVWLAGELKAIVNVTVPVKFHVQPELMAGAEVRAFDVELFVRNAADRSATGSSLSFIVTISSMFTKTSIPALNTSALKSWSERSSRSSSSRLPSVRSFYKACYRAGQELKRPIDTVMHSLYTLNHAYGRGSPYELDDHGIDDPDAVLTRDTWKQYVPLCFAVFRCC